MKTVLVMIGGFVVLVGISILVPVAFGFEMPLVRIVVSLFTVFLGAQLVRGAWLPTRDGGLGDPVVQFNDRLITVDELRRDARYDVQFGRAVVDLRSLADPETDVTVRVDTVFGTTEIRTDPAVPYDVEASSAFGRVLLPDHNSAEFGTALYRSPHPSHAPRVHLRLNAAFGSAEVCEVAAKVPPVDVAPSALRQ
jgi:hypothetical protein